MCSLDQETWHRWRTKDGRQSPDGRSSVVELLKSCHSLKASGHSNSDTPVGREMCYRRDTSDDDDDDMPTKFPHVEVNNVITEAISGSSRK